MDKIVLRHRVYLCALTMDIHSSFLIENSGKKISLPSGVWLHNIMLIVSLKGQYTGKLMSATKPYRNLTWFSCWMPLRLMEPLPQVVFVFGFTTVTAVHKCFLNDSDFVLLG